MNLTLTPLQLVLIALVVGTLFYILSHLVEANQNDCDLKIKKLVENNSCSDTNTYTDCTQCFKKQTKTSCKGIEEYRDNTLEDICQKTCNSFTCPAEFIKKKGASKIKCDKDCTNNKCCKPSPTPPPPGPPPGPPTPPSPPSPPPTPTSIKTCGDWLKDKDNKTKCKGNSIKFWEKPCSDNNCNKSTCCNSNNKEIKNYCAKYVTNDSNQFKYCMKKYPKDMCKHSTAVTHDKCDSKGQEQSYCHLNPNATPKECKGHIRLYYCWGNPNALYKECKDSKMSMSYYCANPNVVNKELQYSKCNQ